MKDDQNNCTRIEKLLLLRQEKSHTAGKEKFIASHLQDCSACREFEKTVNQIKDTVAQGNTDIKPDPKTLNHLKSYFNKKHPAASGFWVDVFTSIIKFIKKPIPLYQAAVPLICAVLVIIFLKSGLNFTFGSYLKPQIEAVDLPGSLQESTFTSDWKQLIEHQKGISASEDSIFSKAYFTTM